MKHLKSDILSVSAQYFDLYDNYAIQDKTSIKYQLWLRNSCGLELAPYTIIHYTAHMYMVGIYATAHFSRIGKICRGFLKATGEPNLLQMLSNYFLSNESISVFKKHTYN